MKIYIVRHGQDDDTVRGGWSNASLTSLGVEQSRAFAEALKDKQNEYDIGIIVSSDLRRAIQTAEIIGKIININVQTNHVLREVNNGDLAGMKNELADKLYPNLYWKNFDWEQQYPNGESPKDFYERICIAWNLLKEEYADYNQNVLLITHGGVINVIKAIENNYNYSNKEAYSRIACCKIDCFFEVQKDY